MKQTRKIFQKRFTLVEVLELRPTDACRVRSLFEDRTIEALIEESGDGGYKKLAYDAVGAVLKRVYCLSPEMAEISDTD